MALRMNASSSPEGNSSSPTGSSSKRNSSRSMSPEPSRGKRVARASEAKELPTPKMNETIKSLKYSHVHQYVKTGRWGAWYNNPTIPKLKRLYFGTHLTEELAARAQDRSLLMYRPEAIKPVNLHFDEKDYAEDEPLRKMLTKKEFVKLICAESRVCYTKVEPTPCLLKFLKEEEALGHFPPNFKLGNGHLVSTKFKSSHLSNKKGMPLEEYLEYMIQKRADSDRSKADTEVKAKAPRTIRLSTGPSTPVHQATPRSEHQATTKHKATPKQKQKEPRQPAQKATLKQKNPVPKRQRPPSPEPMPYWIGKQPRTTWVDID